MNVYELAKKYYPKLWDRERIQALAAAGKLTEEEAAAILSAEDGQEG
ncbi:XkdX family protein [Flavonifractor sp. An82]|nr:XkdX family protein [Flavonifractor sp. An82]